MLGDRKKKNFCLNGKLFHSQVFLISHLVIYSYFVHGVEDGEKENEENKRKWRMKNDGNVARFNDFLVAEQLEVFNFFLLYQLPDEREGKIIGKSRLAYEPVMKKSRCEILLF